MHTQTIQIQREFFAAGSDKKKSKKTRVNGKKLDMKRLLNGVVQVIMMEKNLVRVAMVFLFRQIENGFAKFDGWKVANFKNS